MKNKLSQSTLNYLARSERIQSALDAIVPPNTTAILDDYSDDIPDGRSWVPVIRRTETADQYHARCLAFGESYRQFVQEESQR